VIVIHLLTDGRWLVGDLYLNAQDAEEAL